MLAKIGQGGRRRPLSAELNVFLQAKRKLERVLRQRGVNKMASLAASAHIATHCVLLKRPAILATPGQGLGADAVVESSLYPRELLEEINVYQKL